MKTIEQIHFNYDLDFVIERGTEIFVDKLICINDKKIIINNKIYDKFHMTTQYTDEMSDGTFLKVIKQYLLEDYPDSCTLDKPIFEHLAKRYVEEHLTEYDYSGYKLMSLTDNYSGSEWVKSKMFKIQFFCDTAKHYDTMLYFASLFYGIDNLIAGKISIIDIVKYWEEDLIINSRFSSMWKIIQDLKDNEIILKTQFKRIKKEYYNI